MVLFFIEIEMDLRFINIYGAENIILSAPGNYHKIYGFAAVKNQVKKKNFVEYGDKIGPPWEI